MVGGGGGNKNDEFQPCAQNNFLEIIHAFQDSRVVYLYSTLQCLETVPTKYKSIFPKLGPCGKSRS